MKLSNFRLNRIYRLSCITTVCFLLASSAFAKGTKDGGGGVTFTCSRGARSVYLADTFNFFGQKSEKYFRKTAVISTDSAVKAVSNLINQIDPKLSATLEQGLAQLRFVPSGPLDLLGDDDIKTIPDGCTKTQLAVQHLDTGIVDYDNRMFWRLSPLERALFKLHEAYVHIYKSNSVTVRNSVAKYVWSDIFNSIVAKLDSAPDHGICTGLRNVPFLNLSCLFLDSDAEDQDANQTAALICENSDLTVAMSGFNREFCKELVIMENQRNLIHSSDDPRDILFNDHDWGLGTFQWQVVQSVMHEHGYTYNKSWCGSGAAGESSLFYYDHSLIRIITLIGPCFSKALSSP